MARPALTVGRFGYFDASALTKLAIRSEPHSPLAIALWERIPVIYTSWLSYPETRSAIERAFRGRELTRAELQRARARIDRLWPKVHAMDLSPDIARDAALLIERFPLSGADAVHIASAQASRVEQTMTFVTWDRRQSVAAAESGLNVQPPRS